MATTFRALAYAAATLAMALAVSLAVSLADDAAPARATAAGSAAPAKAAAAQPPPLPSVATARSEKWPTIQATVNAVRRTSSGLVTLVWTLRNTGTEDFHPSAYFSGLYTTYRGDSANGITLTDEAGKVRYNTLRLKSGRCVCTSFSQAPTSIGHSQEITLFEVYKLPASVAAVTVAIPGYQPVTNVSIT